ncbi:MAG: hypothetical protein AB8B62_13350 [Roseobacter sp.]
MFRVIIGCFMLLCASPATAQNCPAFFRFVDFGLVDRTGQFSRGGPIFRGESLDGATLLAKGETKCRDVRDIAKDGHGNPIPVVTSFAYDEKKTGTDLSELRVSFQENSELAAETSAALHRNRIADPAVAQIKGVYSLCADLSDTQLMSCQLVSPYPGNTVLIVYCEQTSCRMPVLAVNGHISVSATWTVGEDFWKETETAGEVLRVKAQSIYTFLKPLMSGV